MPTQITSAGVTFNDATSLTSADGVPSALKLTTARTINGVSFDGTGNITIPATSISGSNVAKAWVNFNGKLTGTIPPRSSYNVSSVTKTAQGYFTITFTTPMANANYVVTGSAEISNGGALLGGAMVGINNAIPPTINAVSIYVINDGGILADSFWTCAQIFGN